MDGGLKTESQNNNFLEKNLLVLTSCFPNQDNSIVGDPFVKTQIDEAKIYFKKIIVISPILFSFGFLLNDKMCMNYHYENVEVYYPRCFYIPIFWTGQLVIDNRFKVVDRLIQKKQLTFDLIHAHFTWPSGNIGVRLKEKYGKPVIITIHENGEWFDQEVGMDHPLINAAWCGANALIRVNRKDVPVLQRYNKCVYAIPNGFPPAFHPVDTAIARERLGLSAEKKIIFALGYLIKRKGFNYLIDAMKQICSQRNDVTCYIGGVGSERGSLQGQIDRLHLMENVRLIGSVPSEVLSLWMNACDLFVLPSLSESFGVVQIEALACGKPVVATRNGGSEEVITSDEYGILVEPADSGDLAEKILIALDCEWDRAAILKYAQRFTWEKISKEIMGVYKQISQDLK